MTLARIIILYHSIFYPVSKFLYFILKSLGNLSKKFIYFLLQTPFSPAYQFHTYFIPCSCNLNYTALTRTVFFFYFLIKRINFIRSKSWEHSLQLIKRFITAYKQQVLITMKDRN